MLNLLVIMVSKPPLSIYNNPPWRGEYYISTEYIGCMECYASIVYIVILRPVLGLRVGLPTTDQLGSLPIL